MLSWWDGRKRKDPLFVPWKPFEHPQLGPVEIGGVQFLYLANRTLPDLAEVSKGTYRFTLDHANKHPKVRLEDLAVETVGDGVYRIRVRVANRGELPTHVTNRGKQLRRVRSVRVLFREGRGVRLLSAEGHRDLGHLAGVTGGQLLEWFISASDRTRRLCEIAVLGGTGGNSTLTVERP